MKGISIGAVRLSEFVSKIGAISDPRRGIGSQYYRIRRQEDRFVRNLGNHDLMRTSIYICLPYQHDTT